LTLSAPRVRPLAILLAVQLVLGGALLWGIASGTISDWLTDDDGGDSRRAAVAVVPTPKVDRFDARRAYAWARRQVALGPRPAGSRAQRRAALFLRAALPGGRFDPVPGGLRNVSGRVTGRGKEILVIAHYDTTPVPGYLGANNSAAAVGAVVELARALRRDNRPGRRPVRFLLTDGEEAPDYPVQGDFYSQGLRGSRADVVRGARPAAVIVLDFIGNKNLRLPRDQGSDPALWSKMRAAAQRVGVGQVFPAREQGEVLDDHTPYRREGIPGIDLIDFRYSCWQKTCDTMDKVSARSIDAAGEAVYELVRTLR